MSLVLITHMGFVARVEHAPAVMDADIRDSHLFSFEHRLALVDSFIYGTLPTYPSIEIIFGSVVYAHVDGPSRKVSE
jgi:hypothetical protein